jgi:hypothetical protein
MKDIFIFRSTFSIYTKSIQGIDNNEEFGIKNLKLNKLNFTEQKNYLQCPSYFLNRNLIFRLMDGS